MENWAIAKPDREIAAKLIPRLLVVLPQKHETFLFWLAGQQQDP